MAARENTSYQLPRQIPRVCFRSYDIRGPVDAENLTPELAYAVGLAMGTMAGRQNKKTVIVGRDGRLSGPVICDALIAGLLQTGIDVVFIGIVATPLLYFATHHLPFNSGVMVTASHNPADHNGFKIVMDGKTLSEQDIQQLYQDILKQDFYFAPVEGNYSETDVLSDYIQVISGDIKLQRPLKVVLDCGNGAAAMVAPQLFKQAGCDVTGLYCELDGSFPNHHPDPTVPENLQDLIAKVRELDADIGLAFDGDADRLGVVSNSGQIIWPDRQLMLFAIDVLQNFPGSPIIFDVKCSRDLQKVIADHGGTPVMWRTGHSIIKGKAFEINAPLSGEMSGHLFFRDRWFGFDDGMYVGMRLLEILARTDKQLDALFADLPVSISTPELKINIEEAEKIGFMQRFIQQGDFTGAKLLTLDGLRIEYSDAWALVRPSNTSSCLTLRFEAENELALEKIKNRVKTQLLLIKPDISLKGI